MTDFRAVIENSVEQVPSGLRWAVFLLVIPVGIAKSVLGFVLEEGWFRRFFERIGVTASN